MALTTAQKAYLATAVVCGVVALTVWNAERGADLAGARPLELPDAPRIWATTAACLGDSAPYPAGVRFYVGDTIPASWVYATDAGGRFGGYAGTDQRIIVQTVAPSDGLVAHEIWHIVHGSGHPASIFGTRDTPPRCGLVPPASYP